MKIVGLFCRCAAISLKCASIIMSHYVCAHVIRTTRKMRTKIAKIEWFRFVCRTTVSQMFAHVRFRWKCLPTTFKKVDFWFVKVVKVWTICKEKKKRKETEKEKKKEGISFGAKNCTKWHKCIMKWWHIQCLVSSWLVS